MLIDKLGYPRGLRATEYDPDFAIRGLHYDFETGWLFKLDAFHNIQVDGVHYGRETIKNPEVVIDRHRGKHVAPNYLTHNLHHLNDLFSLPEACLLADVVQYFLDHNIPFHPRYLADDIRGMAQVLHGHGGIGPGPLHQRIMANITDYLEPNPRIVHYLEKLKGSGKKLFLLTNSSFEFVDKGLSVVTGLDRWIDLFDVVIVSAGKPGFYNSRRPFRRLNTRFTSNGTSWAYVDTLLPGEVYQGGNLNLFSQFTGWSGHRVMYIGDHVFSDLRDPTLQQGWKTGAIIDELRREIGIQNTEGYQRMRQWMTRLEQLLGQAQSAVMRLDEEDNEPYREYSAMLESWRDERRRVRRASMLPFNRQFGSVFRAHQNPSYFANKVISFADVYTSDLENLGNYPLDYVFYPERSYLPHERYH
ncbi:HAD-superfamily hydrolase [Dimargaris cristalligena]|uniref:HAD-superfamily hydrolase n=1 Tax=Dimargaris cristalligena TaxID=215637 RepID=A0A4P9ZVQ0_9FUNG|nr:HAD-superfamily hydrolase [Dimargaris cristalligena]|eukprot:RKP37685.1 HAD-superfamily hydrolase [Dimargaris cristalligena]